MTDKRILVVDDDPSLRDTLAEVLGDEGYEVRSAENGRAALQELEGWAADLVILDLMMPIMDAYAFRDAQREANARLIPILILSAAPGLSDAASTLDAVGIIAKPFRLSELLSAVATTLADDDGGAVPEPSPTGATN
jgi:CheY-like chemotaxis protein